MAPVVDGLKTEYAERVEFREVNFYENRELATKYSVSGHPSLVLTDAGGASLWLRAGVSSRDEIVAALEEALE